MFKLFWAKSQTIFLKQFVSHPPGLIIFLLVNPFQSIRQSVEAAFNQSGNRWKPLSINQAIGGSHFQSIRQFWAFVFSSFISFILFIAALFIGCFIHLCILLLWALFIVRFIHLCALYILCIIYLCTRFNGTELAINQSLLKVIDDHI